MRTELRKDEKKILEVKKHWFVLVSPLLVIGFCLSGLLVFYSALQAELNASELGFIFKGVFYITIFVLTGYFVYKIFDRKFDIWVITNLRIIDESGVFSHNIKESSIDKINNVSFRQSLFGRIFDYGDVQIQTAAEMGATTFKVVSSPKLLKDTVTTYQEEYRQTQITEQAQKLAQAIKGEHIPEANKKEFPHSTEIIKKETVEYAGFAKRAIAFIIDGILLYLLFLFLISMPKILISSLKIQKNIDIIIFLSFPWLWFFYFSLMESFFKQGTLGKMTVGAIVVNLEGDRISFSRAMGRNIAKIFSFLTLGIGFIMASFTSKKQALHDIIAGCIVIKKKQEKQ